jgi:subtilase family protein
MRGIGSVVLKTEPGAEIHALTQLAAALGPQLRKREVVVDLNHFIPWGSESADASELRLSHRAEEVVAELRSFLRRGLGTPVRNGRQKLARTVAVLDTGLDERVTLHRPWRFLDYSRRGRLTLDSSPTDPRGHGTRIVRILDEILPPDVEVVVGKLPASETELTSLAVANALGDIVARTLPDVVNLSLSTVDQVVVCPSCRKRVGVPPFFSTLLPTIIRLAGQSAVGTVAVMAAGNEGKVSNCRWLHSDVSNLVLALAENRKGQRAKYSATVEGPTADLYSASVFGGDDPSDVDPMGVFTDGTHGTSFAAPFVSAAALAAKQWPKFMAPDASTDLGLRVQAVLRGNVKISPLPSQWEESDPMAVAKSGE